MPNRSPRSWWQAAAAATIYTLITLILTWPLARGLDRDVPSDLGDPLLNMWILAWDVEQLRAIAGGDAGRVSHFFDANIFYPAPLPLAYSEHLFAQAIQVAPVYIGTGNPILCYNLLLLSTFVLSGLGAFLLVREMTGSTLGAFIAGLLYAFAPYRWPQIPHIQVISSQWMPFALYGFHRYFSTGHRRALAAGTIALILQNLSCGYYLLYFTPLFVLYVLWEMWRRGVWRSPRRWAAVISAGVVVILVTVPFLVPYKRVRDALQMTRDLNEIVRYSADVYSYATAFDPAGIWGGVIRVYPKAEGELFVGFVALVLAAFAIGAWVTRSARSVAASSRSAPRWLLIGLAAIVVAYAALAVITIFERRIDLDLAGVHIRATNVNRLLVIPLVAATVMLALWPSARSRAINAAREPEAIYVLFLVLAWWLSLGPQPAVLGRPLEIWSPYAFLSRIIPGFEGLRVPARFAMIGALAIAVLAGFAVSRVRPGRIGAIGVAALSAMFLAESHMLPFPVNGVLPPPSYAMPEGRVYKPSRAPAVYRELTRTPRDAVVLELPLGDPGYDLRAVYYSIVHWRRLVNGYSGFFPPHYPRLYAILSAAIRSEDVAWEVLSEIGVTHVVLHEGAYLNDEGARLNEWLRARGATETFRDGRDGLFSLPASQTVRP